MCEFQPSGWLLSLYLIVHLSPGSVPPPLPGGISIHAGIEGLSQRLGRPHIVGWASFWMSTGPASLDLSL